MTVAASPPPPWQHQIDALNTRLRQDGTVLRMPMGTGKSKVNVMVWNGMRAKRVLVGCPKSVVPVWEYQMRTHDDSGRGWTMLELGEDAGTVKYKAATLARELQRSELRGTPLMVAVNFDAMWRAPLNKLLRSVHWDDVLYDEGHKIKSHDGKASRLCGELVRNTGKRGLQTGTFFPHDPLDAFGQCRAVDPSLFGLSWTRFRAEYADVDMSPGYPKIRGFRNLERLAQKLATITYQCNEDVVSLPPRHHQVYPVKLSPTSRKYYEDLQDHLCAVLQDGTVTPANSLVMQIRLQQLTSGFVSLDPNPLDFDGASVATQTGTEKEDMLEEILDSLPLDEPVPVFALFRPDLDAIHRAAKKTGRKSLELSGRRNELKRWQAGEAQVLSAQIQAGSLGVDMTRARYCGFYSLSFNWGDFEQAIKRVHRPGQTRPVHYFHIVATDTINEVVYVSNRRKADVSKSVCDAIARNQIAQNLELVETA